MSLTAILLAVGCQSNNVNNDWPEMPYLPLYSIDETRSLLEDYHEGRPLVVNFYDHECGDCLDSDEIAAWNDLEAYANIDVLSVLVNYENHPIADYIGWSDYYGMNYTTRIADPNDYENYLAALYNGEVPDEFADMDPTIHIYDSDMLLGRAYVGTLLENENKVYESMNLDE